jgi:hypothetical protein
VARDSEDLSSMRDTPSTAARLNRHQRRGAATGDPSNTSPGADSADADSDLIAWTPEVTQSHRDGGPRFNAGRLKGANSQPTFGHTMTA